MEVVQAPPKNQEIGHQSLSRSHHQVQQTRAGRASVTYANGDTFEGTFNAEGQKEGKGRYTWAAQNGAASENDANNEGVGSQCFEGQYVEGKRTGLGKMIWPDGSSYHGQWLENLRHGNGAYTFTNGDIYSGCWAKDVKDGAGTYLYARNNATLVGTWANGEIREGKFVHEDGTTYTGNFVDNKPLGAGKFEFSSGVVQKGEFIQRRVETKMSDDVIDSWVGV